MIVIRDWGLKMKKDKTQIYSNFILTFIFIDLLLLPNFPLFIMPLSLPVVVWMIGLKKIRIVKDKEFIICLLLGILVLVSVLLSLLQTSSNFAGMNVWIENIKRGFQLLTSFLYYFIIKNSSVKSQINLKKIMMIFVATYSLLGVISYLDIALYFRILELLGINNPFVSDWFLRQRIELFRYAYIWIDPNNAAYAFQMIIFYMLLNEKLKPVEKMYLYFSLILSLVLSMSTGALLSTFIFFALYFMIKLKNSIRIKTSYRKIFSGTLTIVSGLVIIGIIYLLSGENLEFISSYSFERMLDNTSGGRLEKYAFMFKDKLPNLIGEGYILIREGYFFRPHSDHLRFMYSYGLVAYFISLWFFFRHAIYSSKYLFVIPGFMAYSINSLIDEQKILLILISLIAYTKYKSIQLNYFNNSIESTSVALKY